ncbi:MAG: helix-turn-helix domain-containing protein, partial [Burkholderiales bacterium]
SAHDWPGNVRQLENVCHWLTVMAPGQSVELVDLPPELRQDAARPAEADWTLALQREVERALVRGESGLMDTMTRTFEKILISRALAHTGGRRIEAANLLGIGRNTITRKIAELAIEDKRVAAATPASE